MTAPEQGPWTAHLVRRSDGAYGVRVTVDLPYRTREAAMDAGMALVAHMDARLADGIGRRMREVAEEAPSLPPEIAVLLEPQFTEPK